MPAKDVKKFKLIRKMLTPSGMWNNGGRKLSDDTVTIPLKCLHESIVTTMPKGIDGYKRPCSRIDHGSNSYLVDGIVKNY